MTYIRFFFVLYWFSPFLKFGFLPSENPRFSPGLALKKGRYFIQIKRGYISKLCYRLFSNNNKKKKNRNTSYFHYFIVCILILVYGIFISIWHYIITAMSTILTVIFHIIIKEIVARFPIREWSLF